MANVITFTVDLDDLAKGCYDDYGSERGGTASLFEAVVQEMTKQLINDADYKGIKSRVLQIRDEQIRAEIDKTIPEAMEQAIQPTNSYGEPKGEPKTRRDLIIEEGTKVFTDKRSDGYRRSAKTLIEEIIEKEAQSVLTNELRKDIEAAKAEARAAVQKSAAEILAKTIEDMARKS